MKIGTIDGITCFMLFCVFLMSITKMVFKLPIIPEAVYYGTFAATLLWMVFKGGFTFSYTWLPFLIAIFLSVLVNDLPADYQVGFRIIAFLSLTFVVGPFIMNPLMVVCRRLLFIHTLTFIRWLVILSFLAWIINPNLVYRDNDFEGFACYSMMIGLLSGISFIYSLYRFNLPSNTFSRYLEVGIAVASLGILVLAGSRSALGSSMLAAAFFYSRLYRHHMLRLGRVLFTVLCLAVLTSGFWWSYTEALRTKMENSEKAGSVTSSRDILWEDRINEFKAFPFFGVGFATINMDYAKIGMKGGGSIEPGSSWLFLLSSMGLAGFLSFSIPFSRILYLLFAKDSVGVNGYFLGSLLFLFLFHMIFEGYIIASGAYPCFFLWLLLSECNKIVNLK